MDQSRLFALMVDLHRDSTRQGPGDTAETLRALDLSRLDRSRALDVADIGCGTGASTLTLAGALPKATITAVDLFRDFLDVLQTSARAAGTSDRITAVQESMETLPFADASLDLIWSEGAIYNMGFAAGLAAWKRMLRPGGIIAVSEITWLHPDPPAEIREHWEAEYPEIATAPEKISILERAGYDLIGFFVLPPSCWIDTYYRPIESRLDAFLQRHAGDSDAAAVADMHREEAALYRAYQDAFSYGFYVARLR